MKASIFDDCSLSSMAKRALADLDRFDSWRSGPPEKPENVSVEFETPQIVRLSKEASPHQNASRAWKRLCDLGLLKGRSFTPPNKLPRAIRDAVDLVAICGEYLGVDLTIPEAELALKLDWVREPTTEHERQWLANCEASCQKENRSEDDLSG